MGKQTYNVQKPAQSGFMFFTGWIHEHLLPRCRDTVSLFPRYAWWGVKLSTNLNDGVVVGVVIRSVERYDLVKIKPTESRTPIPLLIPSLTIKWKLHCRKQRRMNKPITMFYSGLVIGWFFRLCFQLRQSSFHRIISDGVGRNGNVLILPTPIPSSLWLVLH